MDVVFTVVFQRDAWESLTDSERQKWVDDVIDKINSEAYVTSVEVRR
jgi:hypothetical protein